MDRRTYERMLREIRAIHRALTGEELRDDDVRIEPGAPPREEELTARFAQLVAEARSIPKVALELRALGLDDDPPALPLPEPRSGAPASTDAHAED